MNSKMIYLDHAATTCLKPEVIKEMLPYLTSYYGNPSALYSIGRESKKAIELSRERIAKAINANVNEIYFTSGGTESDNWALRGAAYQNRKKGNHIITTVIEHHAILHTCKQLEDEGFVVTYLPVDEFGCCKEQHLLEAIREDTILISIMLANNEIGTIQPIQGMAKIAREKGILFHTDAVQAVGSLKIDVKALDVDLLSISAHKFHGPKGTGALYIRKGVQLKNFMSGGAQEKNKRAGTENISGIVGMGKAIEIAVEKLDENGEFIKGLRDRTINAILNQIPYVRLNGHETDRLPGNVNISFQFIEAESMIIMLDHKGIAVSSGSACASGSLDPSHVLLAIGLPHEIAHGSLRFSFGEENTHEEVDQLLETLTEAVKHLRDQSPLYQMITSMELAL